MALTRLETDAIEDDAITTAKIATGAVEKIHTGNPNF